MQPNCAYCEKPISGRYFRDYWGNNYCADHLNTVPRCDYCGRLIAEKLTGGGRAYPDGRRICGICLKSAVRDRDKGKRILREVHDELEGFGIIIRPFKPDFALIDRSRLKQLDSTGREKQGFAVFNRKTVNGEIREFSLQVYILNGLPETSFRSTCAHELMHIWFYSRGITDASPVMIEGSCNMASYLMLSRMKTPEASYLMQSFSEDKSRIYGKGFQKARNLVDRKGLSGWLEHISKRRKF